MIAEAENYAADQEASRTRKLYAAYSESIRDFRKALGLRGRKRTGISSNFSTSRSGRAPTRRTSRDRIPSS